MTATSTRTALPLATPATTRDAVAFYRHVDEDEMVRQHLSLVRAVVARLAISLPSHVDSDDLYSAGLVGLLNAVRSFDPEGGSSFESYARVRIRGAILDELRRLDWIPRSVHEKAKRVQAVLQALEQANGETPSNEAMADALQMSLSDYEQLMEEIRPATFVCLDAVSSDDSPGETSRHECVADDTQPDPLDVAARHELADLIADRIKLLPEMQRKVLALYYFEDMRLREIAEVFGVTESRICQIHTQAILAIRAHLTRCEEREPAHAARPFHA